MITDAWNIHYITFQVSLTMYVAYPQLLFPINFYSNSISSQDEFMFVLTTRIFPAEYLWIFYFLKMKGEDFGTGVEYQ